jgi:hypothetical protein
VAEKVEAVVVVVVVVVGMTTVVVVVMLVVVVMMMMMCVCMYVCVCVCVCVCVLARVLGATLRAASGVSVTEGDEELRSTDARRRGAERTFGGVTTA